MVLSDQEIVTEVAIDGDTARLTVDNVTAGRTAVVGNACRRAEPRD